MSEARNGTTPVSDSCVSAAARRYICESSHYISRRVPSICTILIHTAMSQRHRVTTITVTEILYRSGRCPCHPLENVLRQQQQQQQQLELNLLPQSTFKSSSRTSSFQSQGSSSGSQSLATPPSPHPDPSTETSSDVTSLGRTVKRRPWSWLRRKDSRP